MKETNVSLKGEMNMELMNKIWEAAKADKKKNSTSRRKRRKRQM